MNNDNSIIVSTFVVAVKIFVCYIFMFNLQIGSSLRILLDKAAQCLSKYPHHVDMMFLAR